MIPTITAYTEHNTIQVPDNEIKEVLSGHIVIPIRGWGYQCVVMDGETVLGWIDCKTLGYQTVKHWMSATDYQDQGH